MMNPGRSANVTSQVYLSRTHAGIHLRGRPKRADTLIRLYILSF
jgi:hypothetical protein